MNFTFLRDLQLTIELLKDKPNYTKCPRCLKFYKANLANFDLLCNSCITIEIQHSITKKRNEN